MTISFLRKHVASLRDRLRIHSTLPLITRLVVHDDYARNIALVMLVGSRNAVAFDHHIAAIARNLCPDYEGGYWHMYSLSNGGFYMSPSAPVLLSLHARNGAHAQVSADTAGIIVSLMSYGLLIATANNQPNPEKQFHLLLNYALQHPDKPFILAAID